MKKLSLLILTFITLLVNAQKKDTTKTTVSYDTILVERNTVILDSVQYSKVNILFC